MCTCPSLSSTCALPTGPLPPSIIKPRRHLRDCCRVDCLPGGRVELHGLQAFDAAVYCASLTAAERMADASTNTSADDLLQTSSTSSDPTHACPDDVPAGAGSSDSACGCSNADGLGQPSSSNSRESAGSSPGGSSSSSMLQRASSDATSYGTAVNDSLQSDWGDVRAGLTGSHGDWDLQKVGRWVVTAAGRAWNWAAGRTGGR